MTLIEFLRGILLNSSIMLAMVAVFSIMRGSFEKRHHQTPPWKSGVIFGLAATLTMIAPVLSKNGMIFDCRSAVTAVAGLIYGPITAIICLPLPIIYRLHIGGIGLMPGLMELIFPAILGSVCHLWLAKNKIKLHAKQLSISATIIGIGSNIAINALIFILMPHAFSNIDKIVIPLLIVNTSLFTIILGALVLLDRKHFQTIKDLAESQRRLDVTLDSIGDAVIACDVDGCITRINPEASKLTGWSHSEAIGQELFTVFKTIDNCSREPNISSAEKVMRDGRTVAISRDAILIRRNGVETNITDNGAPIYDNDHILIGIIMVFRDISHEVMLEQQLRHSQKMDAIGRLASGIAHDFNNMLVGILGNTNLLELKLQNDPEKLELLSRISECAHNAASITRHLLTFSRKTNIDDHPINMHQCIQSTIDLISHTFERNVEITKDFQAKPDSVLGDEASLQQVILNFAINAHHAMKGRGGCLNFKTLTQTINNDDIQDMKAGEILKLIISDTGKGIAQENLEKIFDPFFTTKRLGEGTGMGLATAYGIIKRMGGHISVESQIGKGTVFTLLFPLTNQQVKEKLENNNKSLVQGKGSILVVDDEEHVRKIFATALKAMGYNVVLKNDGVNGLEWFKDNYIHTDLVLLDLNMPRMGGAECFREMKKIKSTVCCILVSGNMEEDIVERFTKEGVADMLYKPFTLVHLSECISKAINQDSSTETHHK